MIIIILVLTSTVYGQTLGFEFLDYRRQLGRILMLQKELPQARAQYGKNLLGNPDDKEAHRVLAFLQNQLPPAN